MLQSPPGGLCHSSLKGVHWESRAPDPLQHAAIIALEEEALGSDQQEEHVDLPAQAPDEVFLY